MENKLITFYIIRHGKTIYNINSTVHGWNDSPLTEIGISQAEKLGCGLKNVKFTTAYSSDSGRASSTAKIILDANLNPKPELTELIGLREWGYGGYEGKDDTQLWTPVFEEKGLIFKPDRSNWQELTAQMNDREIADSIAHNDPERKAENYDTIIKRVKKAIDFIVKDSLEMGSENTLIVSHGNTIPTILSLCVPDEFHGELIPNCSLTILKFKNGEFSLLKTGDTSLLS